MDEGPIFHVYVSSEGKSGATFEAMAYSKLPHAPMVVAEKVKSLSGTNALNVWSKVQPSYSIGSVVVISPP